MCSVYRVNNSLYCTIHRRLRCSRGYCQSEADKSVCAFSLSYTHDPRQANQVIKYTKQYLAEEYDTHSHMTLPMINVASRTVDQVGHFIIRKYNTECLSWCLCVYVCMYVCVYGAHVRVCMRAYY
jgi:hypothetical protein